MRRTKLLHEEAKETRQRKRTVRGEFLEHIGIIEDRLIDLETQLKTNHDEMKKKLDTALDGIARLLPPVIDPVAAREELERMNADLVRAASQGLT